MQQMGDRERVNAEIFKRSGEGPVQETYRYDPTKVKKQKKKFKIKVDGTKI